MSPPVESIPVRALRWLAVSVYNYPRLWFYPQAVLFVVCVLYTVQHLEFSTRRSDLVGADKKYHKIFLEFKKEFPGQDDLVAVVESEDLEKNRQFVERLGVRLEAETNLFTDVFYKGDLKMLGPKALLFLDEPTLDELHGKLKDFAPFIGSFSRNTNLVSLFMMVNHRFRSARHEQSQENNALLKALPALGRIVELAGDSLRRPGNPPSPGINALFGAGQEAEKKMYITFAEGRIYLVTARAAAPELNAEAVRRLRDVVHQTQNEVPGVNVGITGESVLEFDEMAQSQHDTTIATMVSLVLVAIIFIVGYRETGRPIKAMVALIVGLGYTMGYTTLAVGHLNILTITFAPILIGLAIDFGVHLITRYEEELRHGRSECEAMEKAMVYTGLGIFTGCLTTSAAFFAMGLTDFKGIQEMGIISGGGLLVCLVPMMTLLPVLLLRGTQNRLDHEHSTAVDKRAQLERLWLERPVIVLILTASLVALAATQFGKVHFDYNLLNMQTRDLPAVTFEKKLINSGTKSLLFGAVVADSLTNAVDLEAKLRRLPTVQTVESVARLLVEDQSAKLKKIGEIKRQVETIRFAEIDLMPANLRELSQTLTFLQAYLALGAEEAQKEGEQAIYKELRSLREVISRFQFQLATGDPTAQGYKLAAFQQALFNDVRETFRTIREQDDRERLRAEDLPDALRRRFIGKSGKILLQVYPNEDVWQREKQERFVGELRQVDPNATGTPVQLYEYTTLLKQSYEEAALYALGGIALMILIHFRSLVSLMLALLPVAIGSVWGVGFMGWAGIQFNPANIMTLPLVIGIGVTNGIHILNRYAEERSPSILARSTGKAVLVSALTTIAGFGSLMLAKHQGIASLGFVMAVGTATCMIAGLTFLPSLLNLLNRLEKKEPSGDRQ